MKKTGASLFIAAFLLALAPAAQARDGKGAGDIALDLAKVLPCPPQSAVAAGAGLACAQAPDLQKRDYQGVLDAQKNASADEKALAIADGARPSVAQFGRPLWRVIAGASCPIAPGVFEAKTDKELAKIWPASIALFHAMTRASIRISNEAKNVYDRERPYQAKVEGLPQITPLLPVDNLKHSPSYPSGHTAFAYETAMVLSALLPEEQDAIYARAAQYGHNRMIVGVHFPSDVQQGKVSGLLIAAAYMQKDEFRALLEAARPELRKALCR